MTDFAQYQIWFVTGSQHLYGPATLQQVAKNSRAIVDGLNASGAFSVRIILKPVLTTQEAIHTMALEANMVSNCIGVIMWMHTFSPAKMWVPGLKSLQKPFVHLHTQFNRDIPWNSIDMDFMNLNQSAHGDREFGHICARMKKRRKVIVGHWEDPAVHQQLNTWMRAAAAWNDSHQMKIARFGDNMRSVAVTEGDKVEAQITFGYSVYGFGVGELVKYVNGVSSADVDEVISEYEKKYTLAPSAKRNGPNHQKLRDGAQIEIGLRKFLHDGGFTAFTTTFEDLHGLKQLPGIAVQRLMTDGYGFGAEGDWKTAALLRSMKVMSSGLHGGTSFMEDYTYHLNQSGKKVLGAHMLEICETIADRKPSLEVHPLSIGGKEDPPRLVFNVPPGEAINASVIDLGNRFRLIVNEVTVVPPDEPLPKLPVARAVWMPKPDFETGVGAWILAGGAHHTGFSQSLTVEHMVDFAEIADIECLVIDDTITLAEFKKEIRMNEAYYRI